MSIKVDLVIIDGQNDFCNPVNPYTGKPAALYVDGADEDIKRLATFIRKTGSRIHEIHATLDSHHRMSVFHPLYWKDTAGKNPNPFTVITAKEVASGQWSPTIPGMMKRSLQYVADLEKTGRYSLVIWPEHCLIGSWGHNVHPELFSALCEFENDPHCVVNYVTKGSSMYTEAYSVIKAEVPDPTDPTTQVNTGFIQTLANADVILLAGEASSHCVFNSLRDIVTEFNDPAQTKKIKFMEDCSSPVKGFEVQHNELLAFCDAHGIERVKSTTYLI